MANDCKILIEDHNIISLRTAYVNESDGLVSLQLLPASSSMAAKQNMDKADYVEWLMAYHAYLYEQTPAVAKFAIRGIKQLEFVRPPELRLLWTDSGNSVAVYLNGEPWAFIDEHTNKSYSKGILTCSLGSAWDLNSKAGNPWNQELFEKTFAGANDAM